MAKIRKRVHTSFDELKTKDGVLIELGMTVWVVTNNIAKEHVVGLIELTSDGCWISWGWNRRGVIPDECYSTLEAAREAIVAEAADKADEREE